MGQAVPGGCPGGMEREMTAGTCCGTHQDHLLHTETAPLTHQSPSPAHTHSHSHTQHCHYSEVISDSNSLKVFDETSLEIPTATGLDCSIHQTLTLTQSLRAPTHTHSTHLPASHAVKEVFLRSDAAEEPSIHETSGPGAGVIWQEGGQEAATGHERRSLPLQLYLTQETGDLHAVHLPGSHRGRWWVRERERERTHRAPLGSRLDHKL